MSRKNLFDIETPDWDYYMRHRPSYPRELYDVIYDHHARRGSTCWSKAADVGSGVGNFALALLDRFAHVMISDASESYVAKARNFVVQNTKACQNASCLHCRAEDLLGIELNSLDMITIACAVDWTDQDAFLRRAAQLLRPGGTLSVIQYATFPHLLDPADHDLEDFLVENLVAKYQAQFLEPGDSQFEALARFLASRLSALAFDPGDWAPGTRRLHWVPSKQCTANNFKPLPSHIGKHDSIEKIEASPMTIGLDFEWFQGFLWNIYPSGDRLKII